MMSAMAVTVPGSRRWMYRLVSAACTALLVLPLAFAAPFADNLPRSVRMVVSVTLLARAMAATFMAGRFYEQERSRA